MKYSGMPPVWFRRLRARTKKIEGDYVKVAGKKIFYTCKGEGKPMLLLHGNLGCGLWYSKVMDLPGYQTIALDMVNFGRSDRIDNSEISSYAFYLKGFIKEMGLENLTIVAHSLGGAVAMDVVTENPDIASRLILVDPCPIDGLHTPEEHYPYIEQYKYNSSIMKNALLSIAPKINDMKFLNRLTDNAYLMNNESFIGHAKSLGDVDFTDRAGLFKQPVLVVVGSEDILINREMAENTATAFGGSLRILENVGHSLMVENPQLFKEVILNFND